MAVSIHLKVKKKKKRYISSFCESQMETDIGRRAWHHLESVAKSNSEINRDESSCDSFLLWQQDNKTQHHFTITEIDYTIIR